MYHDDDDDHHHHDLMFISKAFADIYPLFLVL